MNPAVGTKFISNFNINEMNDNNTRYGVPAAADQAVAPKVNPAFLKEKGLPAPDWL